MRKTTLSIESLEDRRALAAYTTQVLDPNNLVPADVEAKMLANLDFTMRNMSNFVSWKGTLDAVVRILPNRPSWPGGGMTCVESTMPGNRNAAIHEMTTGIDPYPNEPDCGANVYLAKDGTVGVYGMGAYYDPNPSFYVPADVPAGSFDFVGVLTHEIFHSIGVRETVEFNQHLKNVGGNTFFVGPNTVAALGRSLPYILGSGHYGNTSLPDNPIGSGLMFQWGNYAGNRLDIGKLDLAILRDVGITVKNTDGLPLVDRIDSLMPKTSLSTLIVYENLPPGASFCLVTAASVGNFTFSLPQGLRDNGSFRLLGNNLVTNSQIDYETRSSYTIEVRITDSEGVWTHRVFTISVGDMDDTPRLVVPSKISVNSTSTDLGSVQVTGDYRAFVAVSVFARTGSFRSAIRDPAVWVSFALPRGGGMTVNIIGSPQSVSRNMRFITYVGIRRELTLSLNARLAGVWNLPEQKTVKLEPVFLVPGRLPTLRV